LKELGIRHVVLLSGDHEASVKRLADEVGIDEHDGALLPQQKIELVERLKERHGTVAMVGDGINDAPALACASVGIAMGVGGSDAALETADVLLMGDDLAKLPLLIRLSRGAVSIVKQNIAIALSLKLLFLVLSVAGVATLWMAVLADDGAALIVILNGLRILTVKVDA
jgi:Cd2+/Zn2+-exporting ATPase